MQNGLALIVSVIVLSAIFLGFALVGIQGSLRETQTTVDLLQKKRADELASACMETALYRLGNNENYSGNETVDIGSDVCAIRPVISAGGIWSIETEASVSGHISRIRARLSDRDPIAITEWNEISDF